MARIMSQPERIEYMLSTLGLTASCFAKKCGLTNATVSRWRNGLRSINQSSAHQIEDTFPQFSTPWIMGETPYTSPIAESFGSSLSRTHPEFDLARRVLEAIGYTVETPFELSRNVTDAAIAFGAMVGDRLSVRVTRASDGVSCDVLLSDIEHVVSELLESASGSFGSFFNATAKATTHLPAV